MTSRNRREAPTAKLLTNFFEAVRLIESGEMAKAEAALTHAENVWREADVLRRDESPYTAMLEEARSAMEQPDKVTSLGAHLAGNITQRCKELLAASKAIPSSDRAATIEEEGETEGKEKLMLEGCRRRNTQKKQRRRTRPRGCLKYRSQEAL
ncbi:hypothetical protein GUITHDRAFT_151188, partial [Guillardia theta CCMP2712]